MLDGKLVLVFIFCLMTYNVLVHIVTVWLIMVEELWIQVE
jgi:hypothetical protein